MLDRSSICEYTKVSFPKVLPIILYLVGAWYYIYYRNYIMDNREQWWPYKLVCLLAYGNHPSITYPTISTGTHDKITETNTGYIHITTADLCNWLKVPSKRLRAYLSEAERLGMLQDLKFSRGFIMCKLALPEPYKIDTFLE